MFACSASLTHSVTTFWFLHEKAACHTPMAMLADSIAIFVIGRTFLAANFAGIFDHITFTPSVLHHWEPTRQNHQRLPLRTKQPICRWIPRKKQSALQVGACCRGFDQLSEKRRQHIRQWRGCGHGSWQRSLWGIGGARGGPETHFRPCRISWKNFWPPEQAGPSHYSKKQAWYRRLRTHPLRSLLCWSSSCLTLFQWLKNNLSLYPSKNLPKMQKFYLRLIIC